MSLSQTEIQKLQKRFALFLVGCISSRVALVLLAKYGSPRIRNVLAFFTLFIAIGFFAIYFGDLRKTGLETQGSPIWWNSLRPLHGTFYLVFSLMIFGNLYTKYAWITLAVDVTIGLFAFLYFHLRSGNIQKIFL